MVQAERAARLADVAEAAGVSLATASRSLRGLEGVSPQVAARVIATADALGFVANAHARTLAGGQTSTVGLIVHQVDDPYFTEIAAGVIGAAETHDLIVQISQSGRDPQRELKQLRTLSAHRSRAIIIAGSGYVDPGSEIAARELLRGFPGRVAVIGRHQLGVDALLPDNAGAGRLLATHLLELGHRKILILSGPEWLTTVHDRLAGALEGFRKGRRVETVVVRCDFTGPGAARALLGALRSHPDCTAVLALNDTMAISALQAIRSIGLDVPDHFSVTGIGDVALASMVHPGLTTARIPLTWLGQRALELVLRPAAQRPRQQHVPATLIVRASTRAPRTGALGPLSHS